MDTKQNAVQHRDLEGLAQFIDGYCMGDSRLIACAESAWAKCMERNARPAQEPVGYVYRSKSGAHLYVDSPDRYDFTTINGNDPVVSVEPRYASAQPAQREPEPVRMLPPCSLCFGSGNIRGDQPCPLGCADK